MNILSINQQNKANLNSVNLNNNNKQSFPINSNQNDEFKSTNVKDNKKTKCILAVATALLTAAGITFAVLKGKANKAKLLKEIPENLQEIFKEISGKKGDDFVNSSYDKLVKFMNLQGLAPAKIQKSGADSVMSITGGYDPVRNIIDYSEGFFSKLNPNKQFELLSHELKHCKQFTSILRTEGLGPEKYARAVAEYNVKNAISPDNLNNFMFRMSYDNAVKAGKGEEFIENSIIKTQKEIFDSIQKNYEQVLKLPKIKIDSEEGKQAAKYLEAVREYKCLSTIGVGGEKYKNNLLEIEAYAFGTEQKNFFEKYLKAVGKSLNK